MPEAERAQSPRGEAGAKAPQEAENPRVSCGAAEEARISAKNAAHMRKSPKRDAKEKILIGV